MTTLPSPTPSFVAGVIVLYHPDEAVHEVVRLARPHLDLLYVVDNTPGGSALGAELAAAAGTEQLSGGTNLGLGAAYNLALAAATQASYPWLLVLDQDSRLHKDYLTVMAQRLGEATEDLATVACAGPRYVHPREPERYRPGPPVTDVESVISSGSLVGAAAAQAIGGFDPELFIDYVDVEFSLRARRAGYRVLEIGDQLMTHDMGAAAVNTILGFYSRPSSNYPPLRHYYMTRNALLTGRSAGDTRWRLQESLMRGKVTLLSVVMEPTRGRIVRALAYGVADAVRGRTGELSPERAAKLR